MGFSYDTFLLLEMYTLNKDVYIEIPVSLNTRVCFTEHSLGLFTISLFKSSKYHYN